MTQELAAHLIALAALAAVCALQAAMIRFEVPGPFFTAGRLDIWCVHHDEKLLAHDARHFALAGPERGQLGDYKPYPVSAAFGLAGPWLSALGMRLLGFGNAGLRLWSVAAAVLRHALFFALCFTVLPPALAAGLYAALTLNANTFVLDHHAVLENLLHAALTGLALWCAASPQAFAQAGFWLGALGAVLVLVKPNFPLAFWLMAACLLAAGAGIGVGVDAGGAGAGWGGVWALAASALCFGAGFELAQDALLWRMGALLGRLVNLRDVLRVHRGREHDYLQKHFRPVGQVVFVRFAVLLIDWTLGTALRNRDPRTLVPLLAAAAFYLPALAGCLAADPLQAFRTGLLAFIVIQVGACAPFFYYPKRVVFLIPLAALLFAASLAALAPAAAPWLWPVLAVAAARQALALRGALAGRTRGVEQLSLAVEQLTEPGSTVVMHCYAFRFAWQVRGRRLISGDDQIVSNAMWESQAQRLKADYFMPANLDEGERARLGAAHAWLGGFVTTAAESDIASRFDLYRLHKEEPA